MLQNIIRLRIVCLFLKDNIAQLNQKTIYSTLQYQQLSYKHKQKLMQFFNKVINYLTPKPVSCNEGFDTQLPHDQAASDEDYSPVHPTIKRKVPGFQHILNPVIGLTGQHEFIKGFKFDLVVPLSQYFQIFQTWQIPNSGIKQEGQNMMQAMMGRGGSKPTYTFMTQVAKDVSNPNEAPGLLLMGKTDSEGRVDAVLLKKLGKNLNLKCSANYMNSKTDDAGLGADLQYEDSDSTAVVRLNHHPMQGMVLSTNFMQRLHHNVMAGFDFTHLFAHKKQMFSYGAKIFVGNHTLCLSSIQGGMQYHAGYIIPIRKGLTFVSHYKYDPEQGSTSLFGLRQRQETFDITGVLNSKGKVSTLLNYKSQFYGLKLCAQIDYLKDNYAFGYGISIGQQQ